MDCEYETTCGIVFDGSLYGPIKEALISKCTGSVKPAEESVDVYRDPDDAAGRYREITRLASPFGADDVRAKRRWDHKRTVYVQEAQIPHLEEQTSGGRIIFTTCTYKESNERPMTRAEWDNTVKEDHASGRYVRTNNKRRICFYEGSFKTKSPYTRVSIGEKSTYSGTLEARSACNSIYFVEIEHETSEPLNCFAIHHAMHRLNELLFELLPYDLVRRTMLASNTCSVQRERIDNVFDTFKRNFQNYTARANYLRRHSAERDSDAARLDFYVMPKWDGVRAVGLYYCEGYLLVKDAYGRLASFNTSLPFDNDMVFQLEVVDCGLRDGQSMRTGGAPRDSAGRYYVITELMAVLIKSQNTMFQVYSRNTVLHDTCRNIGNIVDGVSIKTQFNDPAHVCNLYRPLPADMSLRVLDTLTTIRQKREEENRLGSAGIIMLTAVARVPVTNSRLLDTLDRLFAADKTGRDRLLAEFSEWLPAFVRNDSRAVNDCEGLILAYTLHQNVRPCRKTSSGAIRTAKKLTRSFDHGYFKLKHVDTVDLELNLNDNTLRSADGTEYVAQGLPTLSRDDDDGSEGSGEKRIRDWAERPVPTRNRRAIVECYFDGETLRFLRDRCDKSRPDSDSKIAATDSAVYTFCRLSK